MILFLKFQLRYLESSIKEFISNREMDRLKLCKMLRLNKKLSLPMAEKLEMF
jgi:hypothetical protein